MFSVFPVNTFPALSFPFTLHFAILLSCFLLSIELLVKNTSVEPYTTVFVSFVVYNIYSIISSIFGIFIFCNKLQLYK